MHAIGGNRRAAAASARGTGRTAYTKDVSRTKSSRRNLCQHRGIILPMMEESIASKLLRCQPVRSFELERDVAELFADQAWQVNHSVYYQDVRLNKLREIDVVSSKLWRDMRTARSIRLSVVAECKTNSGYHLVFAPPIQPALPHTLDRTYILDPPTLSAVLNQIHAIGIGTSSLSDLRKHILQESKTIEGPVVTFPPSLSNVASSFVETNTKSARDPDQSVLWKAAVSVRSAIEGIRRDSLEKRLHSLAVEATASESFGDDPVHNLRQSLSVDLCRDEYFHSLIVLESPMWLLRADALETISEVRLEFRDASRMVNFWVDVVSANAAGNFITRLTRYYDDMFAEGDMQPALL